jgi:ketosteroid isomerase-like protein
MMTVFQSTAGRLTIALAGLMLSSTTSGSAQQSTDAEHVVAVIDAFHSALARGDSTTALEQLADDVVILESGRTEDKNHYRSGHLSGDMRFSQAVSRERGEIAVQILGDVAWAHSTSTAVGTLGDRSLDLQGAELMVLARTNGMWKIKAVHWSSRQRR